MRRLSPRRAVCIRRVLLQRRTLLRARNQTDYAVPTDASIAGYIGARPAAHVTCAHPMHDGIPMIQRLRVFLFAILLSGPALAAESEDLHRMFEEYFETSLELNPLAATFIGDHRYDDRLTNTISPEHIQKALAVERRYLEEALKYRNAALSEADTLSLEIFINDRELAIEGAQFPDHLLPINQMSSLPAFMGVLGSGMSAQPFRSVEDYERFLRRMDDYLIWSEQAITNMREGTKRGLTYPRILMEKVLPQLAELAATDPQKSIFYQPIANMPENIKGADRERLQKMYRDTIATKIAPSYRKLHDYIRDEYLESARTSVAWSALPDGAKWYAYLAKRSTTTDLTPDEIHELGLREVARIRSEMEAVKKQVGFEGDLAAFFKFLQDDPRFYFDDAESLLEGYRELKRKIDARLPKLFSDFPKASYEVRPVEAFRAQSAAGASYQGPSADGTRPGIFYVNTFNLKAQPRFGMETLSLHEAAPGHHFQIAIQQELENVPRFRRFGTSYVAYVEGWALYAESLGKELGLFTDPYQYYGRLSDEMLRAMRLVVDTGLHTRGWTREQAIKYMLDNSSLAATDVEAEVERYIAIPGQALGYKIGQIRISEIRAKAERALGDKFDIREFHSQVLRDGSLPLGVLEAKIDRWIRTKK